ncbi:MAG: alginate lyase family protein [Pseudonocardiaceae bacterium]
MTERLTWYAARVRAMGPREVLWRAGRGLAAPAAPLLGRRPPVLAGARDTSWEAAYRGFRDAADRPVLLDPGRATDVAARSPVDTAAVVAAADVVLEGRFAFFGHDPVAFPGDHVDWNLDPRTGSRWPLLPAGRIDHRRCTGDPKWIWELNRLQHLPWLAQAWLFTGERRYADGAFDQLDSWLDQNPTGRGIAWRGGFEAGVRALSVAVAVQGLRHAPGMSVARYRRVATMLADSAERSWWQRSRFSSANNHLVGEMSGVATVAILHPELTCAAREHQAMRVLAEEATRQILPDGAGAEQSSAYQIFCSELLLLPAALLRLRGDRPPGPISDALRRGADYLRALALEGEPLPRYGDDDGGFALRLHADPVPGLERHLEAVAAATGTLPEASLDLAASWLAGPGPRAATAPAPPPRQRYAADGGLVVLRRGERRLTMDVGPLGYLSLAAHGHADALAVTLTAGGRELIGDPGTGSYYTEPAFRNAFRGTRMHPTASVDDLDQSVPGGVFLWVRHAVRTVRAVDLARGVVEAEHDGYHRLAAPVGHRRYLVAPPEWDAALVLDLFVGEGKHRIRTAWPLHPELDVRQHTMSHLVTRDGEPVLHVASAASGPARCYAVWGDENQRLGWWSHQFESRTPSWLVGTVIEAATMPLVVATVLAVPRAVAPAVEDLAVRLRGGQIEVCWCGTDAHPSVRVDTRTPGAVSYQLSAPTTGGR